MNLVHVKAPSSSDKSTDLYVNMSNSLIRSAQSLSLHEKRVISLCMAKLDSVRLSDGRYKFKLSALEFADEFGLDLAEAYKELKSVGDKLIKRIASSVEILPRGRKIEHKWVWVSSVKYFHGEGYVELAFSHEMTPHLFLLRKEFTTYKLKYAASLRSIYSWRLFEMLMQFKSTGILRISVAEFCIAMEAPASCISDFGQLRRRIIDPSTKELHHKNNFLVNYEAIKNGGRKVNILEFTFKKNPQQSFDLEDVKEI